MMSWLQLDQPGRDVDSLVGEVATPLDDIVPGAVGRAELRGTVWSARNESPLAVIKGQRCRVVRIDGLMIFLVPEGVRVMTGGLVVFFVLAVLVLIIIAKTAIVVPQQSAFVVERLGRYSGTLERRLPRAAAVRRHASATAIRSRRWRSTSRRRSASPATTSRSASTACST